MQLRIYITVNGEEWGLYLAVEGVEESFLQRNYGKDYGELYKPDSTNMGGGRGNGESFDPDEFLNEPEFDNDEKATIKLKAMAIIIKAQFRRCRMITPTNSEKDKSR